MASHAVTIAIQDKARSYVEQAPKDDFIPLAIKTYVVSIFILIPF